MDVDRIAAMGGVGQEHPTWTRGKMQRKKFTEDVAASEGEVEEQAAEPVVDEDLDGLLDVMA